MRYRSKNVYLAKLEADLERERRMGTLRNTDYYTPGKLGKIFVAIVILILVCIIGTSLWFWRARIMGRI